MGNSIVDSGRSMKVRIREEKTITAPTLVDIKCDVCGNSCKTENRFFDYSECNYEYATLDADWGHYSDSDGKSYKIEICEDCFYDTLAHFKARCKTDGKALDPTDEY